MFDPTGLRIDLRVLLLRARDDRPGLIEHDEARARRALVNRADELSHEGPGLKDEEPRKTAKKIE
jgi:hypothetical protein